MSVNGPIADGSQRAICTYGAKALDLDISISPGVLLVVKCYVLFRVITMTLDTLDEGGYVVIVRHGGCEGGKEL